MRANNESGAPPPPLGARRDECQQQQWRPWTRASWDRRSGSNVLSHSAVNLLPVTVALCGMGDTRRSLRYRGSACAGWLDMSRVTTLAALE
ncbi:MAG: hypothetical protein ACK56F_24430, partial [bacterium]